MANKIPLNLILGAVTAIGASAILINQFYVYAPDVGQPGGPVPGLTPEQLKKFYATREVFKKEFTPEEGLGPLFNGKSCWECHGQPGAVGGEGRDVTSTGVVRIGQRRAESPKTKKPLKEVMETHTRADVDLLLHAGGPALQRKSITSEFPNKYPADCQVEITPVPPEADLLSMRHAGPVFGFGLIEAIPDPAILENVMKQTTTHPKLAGRAITHIDPLTEGFRVGRFGWKNQQPNLINFTIEALNIEMGITSYLFNVGKAPAGSVGYLQPCIYKFLPPDPNDKGRLIAQLAYHQALLAPPTRGPVTEQVKRGEKLFQKLDCAVCHVPTMYTSPLVYVVDPDSPVPKFNYMEIEALENKPVHAYSDFLLHKMGLELADGVPQVGANGSEWRTTPLWGLRFKRFYLHDGRTSDLSKAVLAHGGQAQGPRDAFAKLPDSEKEDLLAFLKSL